METVAFCEFDENARKVLMKHWPHIPVCSDVRNLEYFCQGEDPDDCLLIDKVIDHELCRGSIDVVCGGFPCQDLSLSGVGKGFSC